MATPSEPRLPQLIKIASRARWILVAMAGTLVMVQIIALTPSALDEGQPTGPYADPDALIVDHQPKRAPGIPENQLPDYTIERFQYISTVKGERQWKLDADRAFLFQNNKMVHARGVTAYLFDTGGKPTVITGLEAKYFLDKRDLELYGEVETEFPDGFKTQSDYLRYLPGERKVIIPAEYRVAGVGEGAAADGGVFRFTSNGLTFEFARAEIDLPWAVEAQITKNKETTTIWSDHARIDRNIKVAHFWMRPDSPKSFVKIKQPGLDAQAREADLNYGPSSKQSQSAANTLKFLTLYRDATIREIGTRYATGERAEFDQAKNTIRLTGYPQVYQDNDTVTGDVIIVHRDTDIVDVEQTNAFTQGLLPDPEPSPKGGTKK